MIKLPLQCDVEYHPNVLAGDESNELFDDLCANYGITNRKMLMADGSTWEVDTGTFLFADEELLGFDRFPEVWGARATWSPLMMKLKEKVETIAKQSFQVCRSVYYEDGKVGMDFHSDPPAYGDTTWIASVSLGEEREFLLRRTEEPGDVTSIVLGNGSLIVMGENCQARYEHAIPTSSKYLNPRINLTFRKYGFG